jgi:putative transposase
VQNGICESFNGRFRDEFLVCEQFDTLLEVQVLAEEWRREYNQYRPHGTLGGLTPRPSITNGSTTTNRNPHSEWAYNRVPVKWSWTSALPMLTPRARFVLRVQ